MSLHYDLISLKVLCNILSLSLGWFAGGLMSQSLSRKTVDEKLNSELNSH